MSRETEPILKLFIKRNIFIWLLRASYKMQTTHYLSYIGILVKPITRKENLWN